MGHVGTLQHRAWLTLVGVTDDVFEWCEWHLASRRGLDDDVFDALLQLNLVGVVEDVLDTLLQNLVDANEFNGSHLNKCVAVGSTVLEETSRSRIKVAQFRKCGVFDELQLALVGAANFVFDCVVVLDTLLCCRRWSGC